MTHVETALVEFFHTIINHYEKQTDMTKLMETFDAIGIQYCIENGNTLRLQGRYVRFVFNNFKFERLNFDEL
jgi:hypothetical protein